MTVIPFVYIIRLKLFDKYVHGIDLEAMEAELNALKEKKGKQSQTQSNTRAELPDVGYRSLSQWLNEELSTARLEQRFRYFQHGVKNLLH